MSDIRNLAFSVEEYMTRLARVQAAMKERELDALLVSRRGPLCYLTGMENCYMSPLLATIVPAKGEPILIASEFEMLNAEATSWCRDRAAHPLHTDSLEFIAGVLRERGYNASRIGVELESLTAQQFARLQELLPQVSWQDTSSLMPDIMIVKSAAEIAHMREAGRLSTLGMEAALAECAEGKTDNDLAAACYDAIVRNGGEFMCIEPIVTVGERSGIPHTTFRRTRLKKGDSILLEPGATYFRYNAPLMRSAAIGLVPDEVRRAADAARDSLGTLVEHMKPGALARDVAQQAKAAWTPLCDELIWHGIYAYSVGLSFPTDWNDAPTLITETSDLVLQPGMCFHATTSLRRALHFGVAFSETVVITENGNEVLTGTPRELHVL